MVLRNFWDTALLLYLVRGPSTTDAYFHVEIEVVGTFLYIPRLEIQEI